MGQRILAILVARNREFYRDRAGLAWNMLMPLLIVVAFAFLFSSDPEAVLKVGVVTGEGDLGAVESPFLALEHVELTPYRSREAGVVKVERHQIDMLVDLRGDPVYWINDASPRGYVAERLLLGAYGEPGTEPRRQTVSGRALRYVDWVLPGVLAINTMFSSLWGVGWVIVRYRKNGVLRRLKATPLTAFEFLAAQVISRLAVVMVATVVVYAGAWLLLDFVMRGAFLTLMVVYAAGTLCLISLGLVVASRLRSEETADGLLNVFSWPMMLMSGVWFSLEGASDAVQALSLVLPLTHVVGAARGVMVDGHGLAEVAPAVGILVLMAAVLMAVAARAFRWE